MAKRIGYRVEDLFGDCVTDPIAVAKYETAELGNIDIASHLLDAYGDDLTDSERTMLSRLCENPNQGFDATQEDLDELELALVRILDGRDFCKWLCNAPDEIWHAYIEPFEDADERLDDAYYVAYDIPDDAISLTDENGDEGVLWAWRISQEWEPSGEETPLRSAI